MGCVVQSYDEDVVLIAWGLTCVTVAACFALNFFISAITPNSDELDHPIIIILLIFVLQFVFFWVAVVRFPDVHIAFIGYSSMAAWTFTTCVCACSFASHHSIHSLTLASRRYIIVDIQLIMTGKSRRIVCSVDDYALASLMLYLDIVKLFLEIIGAIDRNPK